MVQILNKIQSIRSTQVNQSKDEILYFFMKFYWDDRIYKIMQNARIFFFAVVEEVSW